MDIFSRLNFLFGTEEYVTMRRQHVLFKENLQNHWYQLNSLSTYAILSGSRGEGISYPPSDDDFMIDLSNRVVRTYREATKWRDLLMIRSDDSPGYCLLLDVFCSHRRSCIHIMSEKPFLSSSLFRYFFLTTLDNLYQRFESHQPTYFRIAGSILNQYRLLEGHSIHGPCISINNDHLEIDEAFCLKCQFWPNVANEWIIRNRLYGWPSCDMIYNIVNFGCHVVPIGDPESPFFLHEWRISFSVAERTLMHSLNHVQFLTYNLLRLVLKKIFEENNPGVFCSYYMKTIIFYVVENTPKCFWKFDRFEECFKSCLSVLYDYVDQRYCPNYFIPDFNMIRRKVNHSNQCELRGLIRTLHTLGIVRTLHFCRESTCLNENLCLQAMELKLDYEVFTSPLFQTTVDTFFLVLSELFNEEHDTCASLLFKIFRVLCDSPIGKQKRLFFTKGIIFYSQQMMNHLRSLRNKNKIKYRLHESVRLLLNQGYRANVTDGKLTMITYMYLIGKTKSAISYIRRLFSEFHPYVLDFCSSTSIIQNRYSEVMCSGGYSIEDKARFAWAPPFRFHVHLVNAFPMAVRMWLYIQQVFELDPLSYAYFLESLIYIREQDHESLLKSTRCLVDRIADLQEGYKAATIMCVGIIKFVQGDSQLACRWLGSIYIMKRSSKFSFQRSAFTYLACLLNKRFNTNIQTS